MAAKNGKQTHNLIATSIEINVLVHLQADTILLACAAGYLAGYLRMVCIPVRRIIM
jgi:hypothetical protein